MKSYIYILILFTILSIGVINCDEPDDETRRKFKWTGSINNEEATCYVVNCDNSCVACTATSAKGNIFYISGNDTENPIIRKCIGLPKGKEGNPYLITIEIKRTSSTRFGFDYWVDLDKQFLFPERESYMSIQAGSFTSFQVIINLDSNAFEDYRVEITSDETGALSFEQDWLSTVKVISEGTNYIPVFSLDSNKTGSATISVIARSGDEEFCLAGECDTRDDNLEIHVYQPKNHEIYLNRIMNTSFNPSPQQYKDSLNKFLEQAVVFVDTVRIMNDTTTAWDLNGNGIFDFCAGEKLQSGIIKPVPDSINELKALLYSTDEIDSCYRNMRSSIFALNGTIRHHWCVLFSPSAGDTTLHLNYYDYLFIGMRIRLSGWLFNDTSHIDTLHVMEINSEDGYIVVSKNKTGLLVPISNDYKLYSSFYVDDWLNGLILPDSLGFTTSCSCIKGGAGYLTHVHELLHQKRIGGLKHVKDHTNIMFPIEKDRTGAELRFRKLDSYKSGHYEHQWTKLHSVE